MDRRRAHAEISLHIGFGRRAAVHLAVVVNEREILSLFVGERFCGHGTSVSAFHMYSVTPEAIADAFAFESARDLLPESFSRESLSFEPGTK